MECSLYRKCLINLEELLNKIKKLFKRKKILNYLTSIYLDTKLYQIYISINIYLIFSMKGIKTTINYTIDSFLMI